MKRALLLASAFVLIPGTAFAADLESLLEEGREASYTAEQIITCSTPEGVRDAVVELRQNGGELQLDAPVTSDVQVSSGYGGWTLSRSGAVVSSVEVEATAVVPEPRYTVDDGRPVSFLGRKATLHEVSDDGTLRARLVVDSTGAILRAVTYGIDGDVYCERRFIAYDPSPPHLDVPPASESEQVEAAVETDLPEILAGFERIDVYADTDGVVFAYYSDGYFSFAVFETPVLVDLAEATSFTVDGDTYGRSFSPGQVTYVWETKTGGMALIGDLPPDMHAEVLAGLPTPERRGWWSRVWQSLFG